MIQQQGTLSLEEGILFLEKWEHEINKGNRSMLQILDAVAQAKTLGVGVISGAPITSKSHLKAMENALAQVQNQ